MLALLRRFFPERIFKRKLEPAAERRLRLAQARAEEAIIRAHVDNALMFVGYSVGGVIAALLALAFLQPLGFRWLIAFR